MANFAEGALLDLAITILKSCLKAGKVACEIRRPLNMAFQDVTIPDMIAANPRVIL